MSASWGPPPGLSIQLESAGVFWDVVKVHAALGDPVLAALGDKSGAVIRDTWSDYLYWLIAPCSTAIWQLPEEHCPRGGPWVRVLGDTGHVAVPPVGRTRGPAPHWAVLPEDPADYLTDTALLHAALEKAMAEAGVR